MRPIVLTILFAVNAIASLYIFALVAVVLVSLVNPYFLPDRYNAVFVHSATANIVSGIVLYGLAVIEWSTAVLLLYSLNRRLFFKVKGQPGLATARRLLFAEGIIGILVLIVLAFLSF